ncbi:MAG TPA: DNA polymerase III subunit epsilon [Methylophilaceae bacterium]|jgi:DNA polymerase-3 subunit epsilon
MRQIFLDTETTGLYPQQGHRIIEIAAVEAVNRRLTKNHFHVYLNPDREIDQGAQEVHGITLEFLQDKPRFADIADDFLQFIAGADLVIHNAPFDVGFLNTELGMIGKPEVEKVCNTIIDTLQMAKDSRPGQRNNLDALCRHYGIDNSKRVLHGALLDAELLADVYMAMTRGQESLMMDLLDEDSGDTRFDAAASAHELTVIRATADELEAHEAYLAALEKSGKCVWRG